MICLDDIRVRTGASITVPRASPEDTSDRVIQFVAKSQLHIDQAKKLISEVLIFSDFDRRSLFCSVLLALKKLPRKKENSIVLFALTEKCFLSSPNSSQSRRRRWARSLVRVEKLLRNFRPSMHPWFNTNLSDPSTTEPKPRLLFHLLARRPSP